MYVMSDIGSAPTDNKHEYKKLKIKRIKKSCSLALTMLIPSTYTLFIYYTEQPKVTMEHDLNMWTPTKRYIISSYVISLNYMLLTRLIYMFLRLLDRLKY